MQINLLAEQETTKTLQLLEEIARKVGVDPAKAPHVVILEQATRPDKRLEQMIRRSRHLRPQKRLPEKDKYSREQGGRVSDGWKRSHAQK